MRVVLAGAESLPFLAPMGKAFHEEAKAPGAFDADHWETMWKTFLSQDSGAIFVINEDKITIGMAGLLLSPSFYEPVLEAIEAFWYIVPGKRREGSGEMLYNAMESWSRSRNAQRLLMINLESLPVEPVASFYSKNGFERLETVWKKEL